LLVFDSSLLELLTLLAGDIDRIGDGLRFFGARLGDLDLRGEFDSLERRFLSRCLSLRTGDGEREREYERILRALPRLTTILRVKPGGVFDLDLLRVRREGEGERFRRFGDSERMRLTRGSSTCEA